MTPQLPSPSYAQTLLSSSTPTQNLNGVVSTISALSLQPHPEGGFFSETDRDPLMIPNPFITSSNTTPTNSSSSKPSSSPSSTGPNPSPAPTDINPNTSAYNYHIASQPSDSPFRHASTTIHYYLAPSSPLGRFHRNKARTVHTLHWGRGCYVVLHPPDTDTGTSTAGGEGLSGDGLNGERVGMGRGRGDVWGDPGERGKWRVEVFTVGTDVARGEKVQWIVEGGRYKASYLMPDRDHLLKNEGVVDQEGTVAGSEKGLLISETVVPGFEFSDHDFLTAGGFEEIFGRGGDGLEGEGRKEVELGWLLGRVEGGKLRRQ